MNESWNSYSEEQAVRNLLVSLGYTNPSQTDIEEALRQSALLDMDVAPAAEMGTLPPKASTAAQPAEAPVASYLDESFDRPDAGTVSKVTKVPGAAFSAPIAVSRDVLPRGALPVQEAAGHRIDAAVDEDGRQPSDVDAIDGRRLRQQQAAAGAPRPKQRSGASRVVFADDAAPRVLRPAEEHRHQRSFQPAAEIDGDVLRRIEQLQHDIRVRLGPGAAGHATPQPQGQAYSREAPRAADDVTRRRPASAKQRQPQAHAAASNPRPPLMQFARNSGNVIYAFTGDRQYLAGASGGHLQTKIVERRATDPVRRGQAMRDLWTRDRFLAQKGRTDDRWRVRQSMLSWDGTTGL